MRKKPIFKLNLTRLPKLPRREEDRLALWAARLRKWWLKRCRTCRTLATNNCWRCKWERGKNNLTLACWRTPACPRNLHNLTIIWLNSYGLTSNRRVGAVSHRLIFQNILTETEIFQILWAGTRNSAVVLVESWRTSASVTDSSQSSLATSILPCSPKRTMAGSKTKWFTACQDNKIFTRSFLRCHATSARQQTFFWKTFYIFDFRLIDGFLHFLIPI